MANVNSDIRISWNNSDYSLMDKLNKNLEKLFKSKGKSRKKFKYKRNKRNVQKYFISTGYPAKEREIIL